MDELAIQWLEWRGEVAWWQKVTKTLGIPHPNMSALSYTHHCVGRPSVWIAPDHWISC